MKRFLPASIMLSFIFVCCYAFADDSVIAPQDFMSQVLDFIKAFGGLPMVLKIAGVITVIISSMKVTFMNQLLWSKLGNAKPWVAPVLGLVAGCLGLGQGGLHITLASIVAYVFAGAGAVFFHEILDSIKAIPGLGPMYVSIIMFLQQNLGGPNKVPDTTK